MVFFIDFFNNKDKNVVLSKCSDRSVSSESKPLFFRKLWQTDRLTDQSTAWIGFKRKFKLPINNQSEIWNLRLSNKEKPVQKIHICESHDKYDLAEGWTEGQIESLIEMLRKINLLSKGNNEVNVQYFFFYLILCVLIVTFIFRYFSSKRMWGGSLVERCRGSVSER